MTDARPATLLLAYRKIHAIDAEAGTRVVCRHGALWITVDGDSRDYVLERGETFIAPPHARTLVYALADSRVDLVALQSRKHTMPTLSRFHAMPLMKAAR